MKDHYKNYDYLFFFRGTTTKQDDAPFREAYAHINRMRAFYDRPFLCLTATANNKTQRDLKRILNLVTPVIHIISPEKTNIKLHVSNISKSPDKFSHFQFLSDKLANKELVDKAIIYFTSIPELSEMFARFKNSLIRVYSPENLPVAMYHRMTTERRKQYVLEEFPKSDSVLRIILATTALGLGVNIPDIRTIYHYGPSEDIESYMQMLGRCGRDGQNASAYLLYTNSQYARCNDEAMKEYTKNEKVCRRSLLLKTFKEEPTIEEKELCCDICSPIVTNDSEMIIDEESVSLDSIRTVSDENRDLFSALLRDHNKEHSNSNALSLNLCTTFSETLITELTNQCHLLFKFKDIQERFQIISPYLVKSILQMLSDIFDDIDDSEIVQGGTDDNLPFDITNLLLQPYEDVMSQDSQEDMADLDVMSQDSQDSSQGSQEKC